jgi:hypothetical protein
MVDPPDSFRPRIPLSPDSSCPQILVKSRLATQRMVPAPQRCTPRSPAEHASGEQFIRRFKHQPECCVIGQGDWQRYAGFPSLNDVLVG